MEPLYSLVLLYLSRMSRGRFDAKDWPATYLRHASVAVVAPDGLGVAASVKSTSVIPSLSGHDALEMKGEGTHDSEEREKGGTCTSNIGIYPFAIYPEKEKKKIKRKHGHLSGIGLFCR